jgi:hypothetical protein
VTQQAYCSGTIDRKQATSKGDYYFFANFSISKLIEFQKLMKLTHMKIVTRSIGRSHTREELETWSQQGRDNENPDIDSYMNRNKIKELVEKNVSLLDSIYSFTKKYMGNPPHP